VEAAKAIHRMVPISMPRVNSVDVGMSSDDCLPERGAWHRVNAEPFGSSPNSRELHLASTLYHTHLNPFGVAGLYENANYDVILFDDAPDVANCFFPVHLAHGPDVQVDAPYQISIQVIKIVFILPTPHGKHSDEDATAQHGACATWLAPVAVAEIRRSLVQGSFYVPDGASVVECAKPSDFPQLRDFRATPQEQITRKSREGTRSAVPYFNVAIVEQFLSRNLSAQALEYLATERGVQDGTDLEPDAGQLAGSRTSAPCQQLRQEPSPLTCCEQTRFANLIAFVTNLSSCEFSLGFSCSASVLSYTCAVMIWISDYGR